MNQNICMQLKLKSKQFLFKYQFQIFPFLMGSMCGCESLLLENQGEQCNVVKPSEIALEKIQLLELNDDVQQSNLSNKENRNESQPNHHISQARTTNLQKNCQKSKFANIMPANHEQLASEHGTARTLLQFQQELNTCLVNFELQYGTITDDQIDLSAKIIEEKDISTYFQHMQIEPPSKMFILQTSSSNQENCTKKSCPEEKSHKDSKIEKDLKNVEQSHYTSESSDDKSSEISESSCKLTNPTIILNESIFTDRKASKENFYNQFSIVNNQRCEPWVDTCSYALDLFHSQKAEGNDLIKVKKEDEFKVVALAAIKYYKQVHLVSLISRCVDGIKIYYNGIKRKLPIPCTSSNEISTESLYIALQCLFKNARRSLVNLIYYLSGWYPEEIEVEDIKNFDGVFERLASNSIDGNTIVTFTKKNNEGEYCEHAFLKSIDCELKTVQICTGGTTLGLKDLFERKQGKKDWLDMKQNKKDWLERKQNKKDWLERRQDRQDENNCYSISWNEFMNIYDNININWNPAIYEVTLKQEGTIAVDPSHSCNQFLLTIPPSKEDLEIRICLEKLSHIQSNTHFQGQDYQKIEGQDYLKIELFDYDGFSLQECQQKDCLRDIVGNHKIYSDVLIFQAAQQKSQYIIRIAHQNQICSEISFCFTLLSFVEINLRPLQIKKSIKKEVYNSFLHPYNTGYGINSPNFHKNLQYAVHIRPTSKKDTLKVSLKMPVHHISELSLIPDKNSIKNLTKINVQQILNNIQTSQQKEGSFSHSFEVNDSIQNYILMIHSYSPSQSQISVIVELYSSLNKDKKEEEIMTILQIQEIFANPKPEFVKQFKWTPIHNGPRKRLKSNTTLNYQSAQIFSDFFNNPFTDRLISAGKYQFFVRSNTFQQNFNEIQNVSKKNAAQPPALSMVVLKRSEDSKQFKIVLDDAFYVPFGIGFWTGEISMENGNYRFVFPKIDQDFSKGTFGIINC